MVEFLRDVVVVVALLLGLFAIADDPMDQLLGARAVAPSVPEANTSAIIAPAAPAVSIAP